MLSRKRRSRKNSSAGRGAPNLPDTFSLPAPAKINLFLHVGDKHADGFHALQSLVVFAAAGDVLSFAPGEGVSLTIGGPFAARLSAGEDNLVLRAARALMKEYPEIKTGARIVLTKNLPVASGIGGGSADAAACLRGLVQLWDLNPTAERFAQIAAQLGSDVPVCLAAAPAWIEGRGETVTPVRAMPRLSMLLVNPGIAVPTRDVFATLGARRSGTDMRRAVRFDDTADLLRFSETTRNDLESPARKLEPVIGEVLNALGALPGALLSRMSGSGATCFAIFPDDGACTRAAGMLQAINPGWWSLATVTEGVGVVSREMRAANIGPKARGL